MESLLNVVWVLVSVLCAGVGLFHYARSSHKHPATAAVVALALISVLLFPVISLSDDLHATLFAFEDTLRRIDSVLHAPMSVIATLTTLAPVLTAVLEMMGRVSADENAPAVRSGFLPGVADRAPPAA